MDVHLPSLLQYLFLQVFRKASSEQHHHSRYKHLRSLLTDAHDFPNGTNYIVDIYLLLDTLQNFLPDYHWVSLLRLYKQNNVPAVHPRE